MYMYTHIHLSLSLYIYIDIYTMPFNFDRQHVTLWTSHGARRSTRNGSPGRRVAWKVPAAQGPKREGHREREIERERERERDVCMYVCMYAYISTHNMYLCIYVCTCVCIYIYIYICWQDWTPYVSPFFGKPFRPLQAQHRCLKRSSDTVGGPDGT